MYVDDPVDNQPPPPAGTPEVEEENVSEHDATQEAVLIPKPFGEPGRPHSGGYNLKEKLIGWTSDFYDEVKVRAWLVLFFLANGKPRCLFKRSLLEA